MFSKMAIYKVKCNINDKPDNIKIPCKLPYSRSKRYF